MFTVERRQAIMDYLKERSSASVKELSARFFIGEATIRRDLEKLERAELVSRTYGGAVLRVGLDAELPLAVRESKSQSEKGTIARLAAPLIKDGDTVMMDSSSTVLQLIPHIRSARDVTAITNGVKTVVSLIEQTQFRVYGTGGRVRKNTLTYFGESANAFVSRFNADTLFFSCGGLSMQAGVTDPNEEESTLQRLMIGASKNVVLLCDHTKFNQVSFCKICDISAIDIIITDRYPGDEWAAHLKANDVELMC